MLYGSVLRRMIPRNLLPEVHLFREVLRETGGAVRLGPFRGLKCPSDSSGSVRIPKLLGIYERELYPVLEQVCVLGPSLVIDIGAAEGYYAVGLAARLPKSRVVAFEILPAAQALLRESIALNEVTNIAVQGACTIDALNQAFSPEPTSCFVLCDCEAFEIVLLDPLRVPALAQAHILVEVHDCLLPGITAALTERFVATHRIEIVPQTVRTLSDYPFHSRYTDLLPAKYRLWAVDEHRSDPHMNWLWMVPLQGYHLVKT